MADLVVADAMNNRVSTTVDLLRHGEPVGGRKYRGQVDDPLSEKGWTQMWAAVGEHHPWDMIVSSTLCRCSDFAHELGQRRAIPVDTDARLVEIGFGEWEGHSAAELTADDPDRLLRFWADPLHHTPPGAETLSEFEARVIGAWNDLLQIYTGQHLLVVGHAGMMRMIIRHVLDMPLERLFRLKVGNAAISRIRIIGEGEQVLPQLLFHDGRL
ncbi:MAG: histidine phosphatase family protein [Proteobacteria bacterium]|jgi:alpha-ribazole phosphatase/probable phosphoglycerate mutase|nr:histidine phosphatase family protein [Pseudomonadota bacterium]